MTRIVFIEHNGKSHEVDATDGQSLMHAATNNGVPGILADCGGACSCGTCHGYLDPARLDQVPAPEAAEDGMLDGILGREANSRLTCQVIVSQELEGLIVKLPASQL